MSLLLLRLVSEACQTFMSIQVSIESSWLACIAAIFLEITTRQVDDVGHYILGAMGPPCWLFCLENC